MLGGRAQAVGALVLVRNILPTGIAGNLLGFLADEVLGHSLSVYKPGHVEAERLISTLTPPVTSGATISGIPQDAGCP